MDGGRDSSDKLCMKLANDFHLLLNVQDRISMNIFLHTDLWQTSKPSHVDIFALNNNFPRQGKKRELFQIWEALCDVVSNQLENKDLLFIHGSPGMGKTFILRELLKKNINDIPHHLYSHAQTTNFFVFTFDQDSCLLDLRNSLRGNSRLFVIARIFWIEFANQVFLGWRSFVENYVLCALNNNYGEEMAETMVQRLREDQGKGGMKKVLLVDDIMKTRAFGDDFANQCRSCLCSLMEAGLFDAILFATQEIQFLLEEKDHTERSVRSATTLSLFTKEESLSLLMDSIKSIPGEETGAPIDPMETLRMLASVGAGHPGSLVSLIHQCNLGRSSLHQTIGEAAEELFGRLMHSTKNWRNFLRVILLAEPVTGSDTLDSGMTFDQMIAVGLFIGSHDESSLSFLPKASKLLLYHLIQTEDSLPSEIRNHLCRILQSQNIPDNRDEFHKHWEILIRYFRTPERYGRISFHSLYRLRLESASHHSESILTLETNGCALLTPIPYEQNSRFRLCANCLYYPFPLPSSREHQQAQPDGWNQLITMEVFPEGSKRMMASKRFLLPVFIYYSARNQLKLRERVLSVDEAYSECQKLLSEKVINLQNGWHLLPKKSRSWSWSCGFTSRQRYKENFILLYVTSPNQQRRMLIQPSPVFGNVVICCQEEIDALYSLTLVAEFID
jgi:hypothetical protein